jgi:ketosteroid isomerase-like protein
MNAGGGNAARVRRAIERWNGGDRSVPLEDIDPDVEIRTGISDAFQGEPFRGHEGARQWLAALDENFETWEVIMDEVHERGDRVVVLGSVRARGRGSGVELDQKVGWVYEFRDGRMIRLDTYYDHAQAAAAGGLS